MKNKKRIGTSIMGTEIDFDKLDKMSGWMANQDKVNIISEDGNEYLAIIPVDTLITCWIEVEKNAYEDYLSSLKHKQKMDKK